MEIDLNVVMVPSKAYVAIRFRWIRVGNWRGSITYQRPGMVAIRFRWIRVGNLYCRLPIYLSKRVAIRFRWIRVGNKNEKHFTLSAYRRNPLSLDKGWKSVQTMEDENCNQCRNPLSLDKGWKYIHKHSPIGRV